jgi:hypothetical protein
VIALAQDLKVLAIAEENVLDLQSFLLFKAA